MRGRTGLDGKQLCWRRRVAQAPVHHKTAVRTIADFDQYAGLIVVIRHFPDAVSGVERMPEPVHARGEIGDVQLLPGKVAAIGITPADRHTLGIEVRILGGTPVVHRALRGTGHLFIDRCGVHDTKARFGALAHVLRAGRVILEDIICIITEVNMVVRLMVGGRTCRDFIKTAIRTEDTLQDLLSPCSGVGGTGHQQEVSVAGIPAGRAEFHVFAIILHGNTGCRQGAKIRQQLGLT